MEKRVLKRLAICCVSLCLLPASAHAVRYGMPAVGAEIPAEIQRALDAALLIDGNTRAVLFQKETARAFSPTGGAVSLMTAYIVLQEADLEQELPIIDGVKALPPGARKLGLIPGRRWLIRDLLAAMLLYGAQDASLVLSDHVSGSQEGFIALMNRYAERLGMQHTLYKNCLGAYEEGQTSTVSDLMILCEAALAEDTLREMLGKSSYDALNGTTIKNRIGMMQEGRENFDPRIKGIGQGSTAITGTNILLYAVDGSREWLFAGYTEANDQEAGERSAKAALDYASKAYVDQDVTSFVKELLKGERIEAGGAVVTPIAEDQEYAVTMERAAAKEMDRLGPGFSIGALPRLDAVPAQGEAIGTAWLRYLDRDVLEIPLLAGSVKAPEESEPPGPQGAAKNQPAEIPVYSAEDWKGGELGQTFTNRYGGWVVVGAATLLACIALLAAHFLRHRRR